MLHDVLARTCGSVPRALPCLTAGIHCSSATSSTVVATGTNIRATTKYPVAKPSAKPALVRVTMSGHTTRRAM